MPSTYSNQEEDIFERMDEIRKHLGKEDEVMARLCHSIHLPKLELTHNVFHDLMSCIIEQQIHYRSSQNRFKRLIARADIQQLSPDNFEIFEEKALINLKLSNRKFESIAAVLDFFSQQPLDWQNLSDEAVRNHLKSIPGLGDWTIDMILLYTLARPNIFPIGDSNLRKAMTSLYQINETKGLKQTLTTLAEKWVPYRSFGVLYVLSWWKSNEVV